MSDGLPPLREVIARHGLRARKSLGQNFILDLNLTRKIARLAPTLDDATIIEIGPGPGGLTRALLLEGANSVLAIERDERCLPVLQEIAAVYGQRFSWRHEDALATDYMKLGPGPFRIVANLPYGIATPLLVSWLSAEPWPPWFLSLTLMFQKEVAERIVAAPGTKIYGRLSVLSQWRAQTRLMLNLPKQAFTPPPKVASAVVEIVPIQQLRKDFIIKDLEQVTAATFGQRRKMLRSSLRQLVANPLELLEAAEIRSDLRAENVSVAQYCVLASLISSFR